MSEQEATQELVDREDVTLWSLFWTFLKIGATAYGGFMGLISVVQNYVVERRKLLTHDDMLDGISLATMLPGPIAVNVVAYTGYRLRGVTGAIVTATAVTLPAFVLIVVLSHFYFKFGSIPSVSQFFQGVLPAVAAIIVATTLKMGQKAITGWREALFAVAAFSVVVFIGGFYSTISVMVGAGILGFLLFRPRREKPQARVDDSGAGDNGGGGNEGGGGKAAPLSSRLYSAAAIPAANAVAPFLSVDLATTAKLVGTFAGMSVMLFGGGFVFIPLMQETIVSDYGWVTQQEFVDSIALGQVTPGPIVLTATFVGYKIAGLLGAVAGTLAIFTPPAIIMVVCSHYLEKIKGSSNVKAILKGLRSAIIGMIGAAAWVIATTTDMSWATLLVFAVALFALLKLKLEVVWIIPSAGIAGLLLF